MTCQGSQLFHSWVLPYDHLVQTVAVGTDKLIVSLGEHKVANLRASVDRLKRLESQSVPEPDVLVSSASTCREQTSVQRGPIDSFDSGLMLVESCQRLLLTVLAHLPDHELIIITSASESVVVMGTPSQTTHFLTMSE